MRPYYSSSHPLPNRTGALKTRWFWPAPRARTALGEYTFRPYNLSRPPTQNVSTATGQPRPRNGRYRDRPMESSKCGAWLPRAADERKERKVYHSPDRCGKRGHVVRGNEADVAATGAFGVISLACLDKHAVARGGFSEEPPRHGASLRRCGLRRQASGARRAAQRTFENSVKTFEILIVSGWLSKLIHFPVVFQ